MLQLFSLSLSLFQSTFFTWFPYIFKVGHAMHSHNCFPDSILTSLVLQSQGPKLLPSTFPTPTAQLQNTLLRILYCKLHDLSSCHYAYEIPRSSWVLFNSEFFRPHLPFPTRIIPNIHHFPIAKLFIVSILNLLP